MLDPDGVVASWNAGRAALQGLRRPTRSSASISRASTPPRTARAGPARARARDRRSARAGSRPKAGACARTAPGSGPTSSSTRSATLGRADRLRQDHPRPHRAQGRRGGAARQRGAVPAAGPGRHRLRHLHARSRRPRLELERRRRADQGLHAGRDRRRSISRASTPRRTAPAGEPARALDDRRARGPLREGGLARPQGRHAASGPTSSSIRSATTTAS